MMGVIALFSGHHDPQNTSILIGQSDHCFLPTDSLAKLLHPHKDWVVILPCKRHSLGTLYQQSSQIVVSTLGDAAEATFPSTGVLLGCQAQSRTELRTIFKLFKIPYRGNQSRGCDGADPHQLSSTLDLFVHFLMVGNALIAPFDVSVKLSPVFLRSLQNQAGHTGDVITTIFNNAA